MSQGAFPHRVRRRRLALARLVTCLVVIGAFLALPSKRERASSASAPPRSDLAYAQTPELPEPGDPGDEPGEAAASDTGVVSDSTFPAKAAPPPPTVPDSLVPGLGASLPVDAPPETLGYKPPRTAGRSPAAAAVKPPTRRPPFGLHPAAIFALLVIGHVFLIRAVTD